MPWHPPRSSAFIHRMHKCSQVSSDMLCGIFLQHTCTHVYVTHSLIQAPSLFLNLVQTELGVLYCTSLGFSLLISYLTSIKIVSDLIWYTTLWITHHKVISEACWCSNSQNHLFLSFPKIKAAFIFGASESLSSVQQKASGCEKKLDAVTWHGRNWPWTQLCKLAHRHSSRIRKALKIYFCKQKMAVPFSHGAWLAPSSLLRVDSFTAGWPFRRADAALPRLVRGKRILFAAKCQNNPQWQPPILQRLWPSGHSACFLYTYRHLFTHTALSPHLCALCVFYFDTSRWRFQMSIYNLVLALQYKWFLSKLKTQPGFIFCTRITIL